MESKMEIRDPGYSLDQAAFWVSRWRKIDRAKYPNSALWVNARALHFIRRAMVAA